MITFKDTVYMCTLDVIRDQKVVGVIQWHRGPGPKLVPFDHETFSLSELRDIVEELEKQVRR